MNTAQTRQASLYLHTINDFERIGDHASYIAHMSSEMHDNHTNFSQEAWDELNIVMEAVREDINITCNAFMKDDKEMAQRDAPLGAVITGLCDVLKMRHASDSARVNAVWKRELYSVISSTVSAVLQHIVQVLWLR